MSNPMTLAKAALRTIAKARRAAIPPAERQAAAERLAETGLDFLGDSLRPGTLVGGFMPIGEEISPLPLMARLHREGCRLALPVMVGKGQPLEFRAYSPGDQLVSAVWGIREPTADKDVVYPQIVLTALLAFDDQGFRLGYGGGYYDRTLAALRLVAAPVSIGLGYDEQRVDAVPHLDYDERLDWILTPSGARRSAS
jgi:5-formyltetrahydrofolate cyclo-ligase